MASAAISAASWVVSKALSPLSDGLLEKWAAASELSSNLRSLKTALLHAQSVLRIARRRRDDQLMSSQSHDSQAAALAELRRLADDAEDALDELDYFRIQDELEGTDEAADAADAARGCLHGLAFNPRHTAKAVVKRLACSSSCGGGPQKHDDDEQEEPPAHQSSDDTLGGRRILRPGKWLRRAPRGTHVNQQETTKLEFDRVGLSKRMKEVAEQLVPLCQKVSEILNLEFLASGCATTAANPGINRPVTTSQTIESKLYGRDNEMAEIIHVLTRDDRYCGEQLTVIPIVGPGGIGKTTLTQNVYCSEQVQSYFDVKIWVCVSRNFNVNRLTKEIHGCVAKQEEPNQNLDQLQKQLEQALQHKRFLLVLDDMWDDMWKCGGEDEWKRLLLPLRKGKQGSIVLVTTRIPEIAHMVKVKKTVYSVQLEGIEPKEFWDLFKQYAFVDDQDSKEDTAGLLNIGERIVEKLKGSPLAAKTVGSLLRKHLTLDHWTRVLDSELWKSHSDGIMPALKLSYDYLPFHLQQCFSYCALFPDDHKFDSEELIYLWIGMGILHSNDSFRDQNSRPEEIGSTYLDELVGYGFFKREETDGRLYYVVHDLLNDLARVVSKQECLCIDPSTARQIEIQSCVRHLSIIMSHADSRDVMTEENFLKDLSRLSNLKSENLHSLILLGDYDERFASIFGVLLGDAKALRVLLSSLSCSLESILKHFPKLAHLRYLRLTANNRSSNMQLPKTLSRFYHLKILDLKGWNGAFTLPGDMSNLVKLCHFLVRNDDLHSNISDVGKLQFLQELKKFKAKKESNCFKLCQLGQLGQLGGSISIYNLENVQEEEEADAAKLWHKDRLRKLTLAWHTDDPLKLPEKEGKVLERLQPHDNIRELCIIGNGGPACPPWLGTSLSVKTLESLSLVGVDWKLLPPLGDLFQLNELNKEYHCCVRGQMFTNLKSIELAGLPRLKKWVGKVYCHLFALLEVLIVRDCCELVELPFSQYTCCPAENDLYMDQFPKLREVVINGCPKLQSLPPVPWSRTLCDVHVSIKRVGSYFKLSYSKYPKYYSSLGGYLSVDGGNGLFRNLDEVLAFHNLIDLKELKISKCPPLAVEHLKMLTAMKTLRLEEMSNVLTQLEGCRDISQLQVESLNVINCGASGKELTQLLNHFPKLLDLWIICCPQITRLVGEQQLSTTLTAPSCSSYDKGGEEEEEDEGLLLLPQHFSNSLTRLTFSNDSELRLVVSPHFGKNPKARGTHMHVGALQALCSLQRLAIWSCPKFLSGVGSSSQWLFPSSLKYLWLDVIDMKTLEPISNLTSLTDLVIRGCGKDLTGEGLQDLLTQGGHLTRLHVHRCPQIFSSWESWMEEECLSSSTMLQQLETDDFAGVLVEPVCRFFSSSLCKLALRANDTIEHLTRGQEEALRLLTSLQELTFEACNKLRILPAVRALANLKILQISNCPAVQSLQKEDLPSSLQILDVCACKNEELRQHCRKMKGIPKMYI